MVFLFFRQISLFSFCMIRMVNKMELINKILWAIATVVLLVCGIYFTIRLKGVQFRFSKMLQGFKEKEKGKITPFETLMMATAGRIGVGSLAGIALAIYVGGVGTIFWLWISAILTAPNAFVESCLGVIYKEKEKDFYKGGPSYYMDKGLGKKRLAKIYAVLIIIAYIFGFLTIQSNTITRSLESKIPFPPIMIGILIALLSAAIIWKGVKGVANATSKLVPVMGVGYILVALFIIIKNVNLIPGVFSMVLKEALNIKSFGFGIISSLIIGVQRGIFSSEAGIGSGAIASATSDSNNPVGQGLIQILGIYFTSLIICTSTALIILTSNYQGLVLTNINGIEITQYALQYHLGAFGEWVLIIAIVLFSFSTILTGYYYGESSLKYLWKGMKEKHLFLLKIITILLLVAGSIISATFLWEMVDIFVALMAIINIYAIFLLRKDIIYEWNNDKQKKKSMLK